MDGVVGLNVEEGMKLLRLRRRGQFDTNIMRACIEGLIDPDDISPLASNLIETKWGGHIDWIWRRVWRSMIDEGKG